MSLWKFAAAVDGYNEFNSPKDGPTAAGTMSVERLRELNPPRVLH